MRAGYWIYFAINAWAGLLLAGIGVPFMLQRIRPNIWSGLRTEKTLSDPAVWYAANRLMGIDFIVAGAALLVSTSVTFFLANQMQFLTIVCINLAVVVVSVTFVVFHSLWIHRRT